MNIKNRIGKLEDKTGTKSGFCECKETNKNETYWQDLTSDGETTEPQIMSDFVPNVCPFCKRKVEKGMLIIQFVEPNIPKSEQI